MSDLTFSCPVCGADVPRKAKSCPECGACEKSGWSEDQYLDGIDLPEEDYTSGRLLGTGSERGAKWSGMQRFWGLVALIVLVAFLWLTFGGRW
jgi:hypothetical protein